MLRVMAGLILGACCTPLWAFEIPSRTTCTPALFDAGPVLAAQDDDAEEGPDDGPRVIDGRFGRGVGLSFTFTGAVVFPAAGIGLDVAIPVHEVVSIVGGAHLVGGAMYEGSFYDLGARGYLDLGNVFSFYGELGFRLAYGRSLDYVGGTPDPIITSAGIGGYLNLGLEIGSHHVRFHTDITLNGTDTLRVRYEVGFFMGFRFGLRAYFGA